MTFAGFASTSGRAKYRTQIVRADFAFAQQLRGRYPKGFFFFAKSRLAHTELLNAIDAAEAPPGAQVPPQSQNTQPRNELPTASHPKLPVQQAKRLNNAREAHSLRSTRERVNYREDSEEAVESEEFESEESDDDDEFGDGDSSEDGRDSDIEIIDVKEEEESDSDVEIIENPRSRSKKRLSPQTPSLKRSRDEGGAHDKPPSPAPQPIPSKNKKSGGTSKEAQNLRGSRFNDRTKMQRAEALTLQRAAQLKAFDAADKEDIAAAEERLKRSDAFDRLAQAEREIAQLDLARIRRRADARAREGEQFGAKFGNLAASQGTANWH